MKSWDDYGREIERGPGATMRAGVVVFLGAMLAGAVLTIAGLTFGPLNPLPSKGW